MPLGERRVKHRVPTKQIFSRAGAPAAAPALHGLCPGRGAGARDGAPMLHVTARLRDVNQPQGTHTATLPTSSPAPHMRLDS